MRGRRRAWPVFLASSAGVLLALAWISATVLRLEVEATAARHEQQHEAAMNLALWRLDGWVAARLAPEASRPANHYLPHWIETAVGPGGGPGPGPGAYRESPLLNYRSPLVRLHFQIWPDGSVTSPQAPYAEMRERKQLPAEYLLANDAVVDEITPLLADADLARRVTSLEAALNLDAELPDEASAGHNRLQQQQRVQQYAPMRRGATNSGPEMAQPTTPVEVGPLVAVWLGGTGERLAFVRRIARSDMSAIQGFLVDWEALTQGLRQTVADTFPDARIEPVEEARVTDDTTGRVLASVPAALVVDLPPPPPVDALSSTRVAVLVTWLAVLLALGSAVFSVRTSLAHAERRDRFASAVTHELRTPLTSFRMVADLLADDMVPDPARRQEHLESLRSEAERLSAVVENVLAYSQVERGGAPVRPAATTVAAIAERLRPVLARRAQRDDVGFSFSVDGEAGAAVITDADVLQRIALNLVDNACKYGGGTPVAVAIRREPEHLTLEVSDGGRGVPERLRIVVFEPFDRGSHVADAGTPGVGLGLPLSRALARRLGGDLVLVPATTGARFRLTVPA